MMKLDNIRAAGAVARKRGADMTNALLWAAFAIVVLISILGMYQVVQLNSNKTSATRTASTVSNEARTLFRNAKDFSTLNNALLIQAGAVTNDATDGTSTITLPYGTAVAFGPAGTGGTTSQFDATLTFADTRGAKSLCTFLTSGEKDTLINGPMGSDYIVPASTDCSTAGNVIIRYQR